MGAIKRGEIEKEIAVDIRIGKNDLVEMHLAAQLGAGGDALQGAQHAALARAMGDEMEVRRGVARLAILRELDEKIRNRLLARLDARLIRRISRKVAARGPAEEGDRPWDFEVVADLRRADRRVFKADIVAVQKHQRLRLAALLSRRRNLFSHVPVTAISRLVH